MSDAPQGPGWWQASDLKWYPPADRPGTGRSRRWLLPAALLVVVALVAGGVTFLIATSGDEADAVVLLEPVDTAGPDPFTESVSITEVAEFPDAVNAVVSETIQSLPRDDETGTLVAVGDTPGLYGGTGDDATCDVAGLARFLTAPDNQAKAAAWAQATGIDPGDIPSRLERYTPTVLTADTRVTNHGFSEGRATPRESVLQAGTAVLVDDAGVPRVRCSCGNPLGEPTPLDLADTPVTGPEWASYAPESVASPVSAPEPMREVTLVDVVDAELYQQPVGSPLGTTWVAVGTTADGDDRVGDERDGDDGLVHTSPDGVEWSSIEVPGLPLRAVAHGNGRFVAIGVAEGRTLAVHSEDGSTWSQPIEVGDQAAQDVAFGNGRFVVLGTDRTYTSGDGQTWTEQPVIGLIRDVDPLVGAAPAGTLTFGDGRFSAAINSCGASRCVASSLLTSVDGIAWTTATAPAPDSGVEGAQPMAHGDRLAVVGNRWEMSGPGEANVDSRTSGYAAELVDERWRELTLSPAGVRLRSLSVHAGSWYAVGSTTRGPATAVYRSPDLSSWSEVRSLGPVLRDVVVASTPSLDVPRAPTTTTTTPEPEPATARIVLRTASIEVLDDDGSPTEFPNSSPTDTLIAAITAVLGDPDDVQFDGSEVCGPPVTVHTWGSFRLRSFGPSPEAAGGFRGELRGVDEQIATLDGVTVGTPMADVLARFPGSQTLQEGTPETRVLLDPDPSGDFGVVVQGGDRVDAIFAPYVIDQFDDC